MPGVDCQSLTKSFGTQRVIDSLSLEIEDGELFSLLGPSGCGKSTLLRMIAGLELPDSGRVLIGDRDVTNVPAHQRGIGMVFQQYALFPHLTIFDNVRFGLDVRRKSNAEQRERVRQVLELVQLSGFENRYPHQLSGGQQQRIALARALAIEPSIVLLDEPLSNLDAKLRHEIRVELREMHRSLALTMIHVTHDQEEALSVSDRIALLFRGRIAQLGTPEELFERPASVEVASFLGEVNAFPVTAMASEGAVIDGVGEVRVGRLVAGDDAAQLVFRPGKTRVCAACVERSGLLLEARVRERVFLGSSVQLVLQPELSALPAVTAVAEQTQFQIDDRVLIHVPPEDLMALPVTA